MELSEIIAGIFFFIILAIPIWIGVSMVLQARCPRCRRIWARKWIGEELRIGDIDSYQYIEHAVRDKDDSSLDSPLDLEFAIFYRYRCKYCGNKWEKKRPPRIVYSGVPPPP